MYLCIRQAANHAANYMCVQKECACHRNLFTISVSSPNARFEPSDLEDERQLLTDLWSALSFSVTSIQVYIHSIHMCVYILYVTHIEIFQGTLLKVRTSTL